MFDDTRSYDEDNRVVCAKSTGPEVTSCMHSVLVDIRSNTIEAML
jgi:hypothetical protein